MRLEDAPQPEDKMAGWYKDPLGGDKLRLFDGKKWTPRIRSNDPADDVKGEASAEESTATSPLPPLPPSSPAPSLSASSSEPPPRPGIRWRWHRLPNWGKWATAAFGAFLVLVIGIAIGGNNEEDLKAELSKTESHLETAENELERASDDLNTSEEEVERLSGLRDKIVSEAQDRAEEIVSASRQERDKAARELLSLQTEVNSTEGELANAEGSLQGAEETQAKSSIPGDGTFKSEVDYLPGTYRSEGGSGCYWATLNSADPYDIASNENATGPTIASITSPYFQTSGCGTWERIEE
jgi:F0F1-type ATP synthase membrane subunit b/b'